MPNMGQAAERADSQGPDVPASSSKAAFVPPTYTMKEIYDAIPSHCLHPNTLLSLFYVLRDFCYVATLMCLATQIHHLPNANLQTAAWATYAFLQGLVFTGLWELAHECGHGALSKYKLFNNVTGLIIHSLLFVPFHSWRFTHATHHKSTNNLDRDIAFVPDLKEAYEEAHASHSKLRDYVEDMPIVAMTHLFFHQLIAFPTYLTINNFALARMNVFPWWTRSHFYLGDDGPNFKKAHKMDILISDICIAVAGLGMWGLVRCFGAWNMMLIYGFPYLVTNHWILTITFLQHTDGSIPYYQNSTWTFLRGAASTVDRDFGWIGRNIFHGALETHVMHHHVSRIPFYYASEATLAVKKVMGEHYQSDFKTPYLWSFWKNYRTCRFVEETKKGSSIYFFAKNK
ncbi:related to Delta(12) fatty acid desaturase [Rhynchosporium agropyri]|uniref:Related to Delta(12) fatty acid desaturase n=1 Tax=Rhynchosporium agropyri TaxID=914238 RepID=A0A1E1KG84_9HELO|nr:related to Delta(12) fatty acid desaturase [Rhynchosporium agropyri]